MSENFQGQNLQGRSFIGKNLNGANFSHADIRGANFRGADLTGANFSHVQAGVRPLWKFVFAIAGFPLIILLGILISFTTSTLGLFIITERISQAPTEVIFVGIFNFIILGIFAYILLRSNIHKALLTTLLFHLGLFLVLIVTGIIIGIPFPNLGRIIFSIGIMILLVGFLDLLVIAGILATAILIAITRIDNKYTNLVLLLLTIVAVISIPFWLYLQGFLLTISGLSTIAVIVLGQYVGKQAMLTDGKYSSIYNIALAISSITGTSFKKANLTDASFTQARLANTDFRAATLTRTEWFQAQQVSYSRLEDDRLQNSQIRDLLVTGQGSKQNFNGQQLQGLNLQGANLTGASFINTHLDATNLQAADLSDAILVRTSLESTDLRRANITGVCIEDWGIYKSTKLEDSSCKYVYLKLNNDKQQDKFPQDRDFEDNEFIYYVNSFLDTIDLYHDQDFDYKAAILVLKNLATNDQEAPEIVGLEKQGTGFKIKLKNPRTTESQQFKRDYYSQYEEITLSLTDTSKLLPESKLEEEVKRFTQYIEQLKDKPKIDIKSFDNKEQGIAVVGENIEFNSTQDVDSQEIKSKVSSTQSLSIDEINNQVTQTINNLSNSREFSQNYQTVLSKFQDAILTESEFSTEDKVDALEQVQILAEAWNDLSNNTEVDQVKIAINYLKGMNIEFPDAIKFGEACRLVLPAIYKLLNK